MVDDLFTNKVLTSIEPKETIDLELSQDTIDFIDNLANKTNSTEEEVISHLLEDSMSTVIDINDFKKMDLIDISKNIPILLSANGKIFARITPASTKDTKDTKDAGDPIGYADLTSSYWQQHLVGAGRI